MEGSGSLPDGAFERFVTSALAAIITIVFSWRLLAEEQRQFEGANRPRPHRPKNEIDFERRDKKDKQSTIDIPIDEDSKSTENGNAISSDEIDENFISTENTNLKISPKYATLDAGNSKKSDDTDSPSWGDYSWEEDMYDTVHTRRKVTDFTPKRSSESSSDEHDTDIDIQLSPIPASHEMLEQLYMNQEYRSIVDDEQHDESIVDDEFQNIADDESDSSDSDDDLVEGVYESPNIENDMFYASGLEPIIEEDSDDFEMSDNEDENDECEIKSENLNDEKNQNTDDRENRTNRTCSQTESCDNMPEGTERQDLVKCEVNNQSDINCLQDYADDTSSLPDLADDNQTLFDNYIDECFDNCIDDSGEDSDESDSLPPSPIVRTRAIDEEYANLSDESCSSGSVITVISVKSEYSDTPEIQIVEDSNKPLSFIYTDNESNIHNNIEGGDIIAFIHGTEDMHFNDFDPNKTPDNDVCNDLVDELDNTHVTYQLDYADFIKDIQAVSETNNALQENTKNTDNLNKSDECGIVETEKTESETCIDENELIIRKDNDIACPNIQENESSDQHIAALNEIAVKSEEHFENKFEDDDGVVPREYNPYEDDFAEFEYCDSDDDSFYLVCGETKHLSNFKTFNHADSGNLRNFDTFDNLDAVGLSPGLDSSCESGMSDDGRFIFSRTEEISTEYRTRLYTKDRDTVQELNNIELQETEGVQNVPQIDTDVENKNSYNERKGHEVDSGDPIIADLENIELFIDESKIKISESNAASQNNDLKDNSHILRLTAFDEANSNINYSPTSYTNDECVNNSVKTINSNDLLLLSKKMDINGNNKDEKVIQSNKDKEESSIECKTIDESICNEKITKSSAANVNTSSKQTSEKTFSNEKREFETSLKPCIEILTRAHDSGIDLDSDSVKYDSTDKIASPSNKYEILDLLHSVKGQIDRTSTVKPSLLKGGTKTKIQQQKEKHRSKSYVSVLQQPVSPEIPRNVAVVLPEKSVPKSRQQIIASRKKFLSEQNLISDELHDKFQQHKTSFEQVRKPRYLRRGNSLPKSSRRRKSYDKLDFNSLNSSRSSSVEKPEICTLHDNCIFSPLKHKEILDRTLSIDNLESSLMRYGSVASLVETDIDSGETTEYQIFTDFDTDFEFQFPLERTASMSDLATKIKNIKESKGRFNDRNVPKSKSLCALETNIDDVDEIPQPGTLGRVPSVHELRVSKSLQKLNVPDWYKKSSVSRSGSTWSLYTSPRKDSFSSYGYSPSITSSPCPSVSLNSNSVVIRTRITPSAAKLLRSPKLQTTPEKSPIPITVQLPSEKLRQKEKSKELMPIPIVPFTKLRLMFEENSRRLKPTTLSTKPSSASPVSTPTTPVSPSVVMKQSELTSPVEKPPKPVVPAKPILKRDTTSPSENKNVGHDEPRQTTPLNVQPLSTSPRSGRRVETTFNGSVGQTEVRKAKETTFEGEKPVQVVKPKIQEQVVTPQISKDQKVSPQISKEQKVTPQISTENQTEHNSKSARYSSLSKSLKSAFRRPQKSSAVSSGGSKIETTV